MCDLDTVDLIRAFFIVIDTCSCCLLFVAYHMLSAIVEFILLFFVY